ncbi:MAG TPA: nucleotidyltransferase substrate binding protein [Limnochordales bacterium]
MSEAKLRQSVASLGRALGRLDEALREPDTNPLAIDGTIQRFEFAIELLWKTLKRVLEHEGIQTRTPREALREAYQAGWLDDEVSWLQMLRDRNETSHIYDEVMARKIYERIREYAPKMRRVYELLVQKYLD